jgi:hypothetical protein
MSLRTVYLLRLELRSYDEPGPWDVDWDASSERRVG